MLRKWFWKRESQQLLLEEETHEPEIDETLVKELEAKRLWGSLRSWFLEKGYTLFEFSNVGYSFPLLDTPPQNGEYPYAFCGGNTFYRDHPLYAYYSDKICFAQDSQRRHVAIKKLNKPDEIRIYRLLFEKRELLPGNCILPVLEILEYEEICFAVTPRWGEDSCYPNSGTIGNVLNYIHCILKDLKEDNTLVNHFGAHGRNDSNSMRPELRAAGLLTYALFDFDLSLMLPSNNCRLPAGQSFEVLSITWPYDTSQGEIDYEPYKFEMGCLGIVLCQMFQNCIPFAPFLAPFLDRLITHRLEFRFNSLEALQFFEEMRFNVTPEQLSIEAPVDTTRGYSPWEPDKYNRWENLPDEFVREWSHFRAPAPSYYTKFLRLLCRNVWGHRDLGTFYSLMIIDNREGFPLLAYRDRSQDPNIETPGCDADTRVRLLHRPQGLEARTTSKHDVPKTIKFTENDILMTMSVIRDMRDSIAQEIDPDKVDTAFLSYKVYADKEVKETRLLRTIPGVKHTDLSEDPIKRGNGVYSSVHLTKGMKAYLRVPKAGLEKGTEVVIYTAAGSLTGPGGKSSKNVAGVVTSATPITSVVYNVNVYTTVIVPVRYVSAGYLTHNELQTI